MASKRGGPRPPAPTPSEVAFQGRPTAVNAGGFREADSAVQPPPDPHGAPAVVAMSQFPHLSPASDHRAEHVTSARLLSTGATHSYHERFSQDNRAGAPVLHDRFFAVDLATGAPSTVAVALRTDVHVPRRIAVPERGSAVSSVTNGFLAFGAPGAPGDEPPLSPRSRTRTVTDDGVPNS